MSVLDIRSLAINRSGLPVVCDASLSVRSGEVVVVLGANGAGKTTLLEGISGVISVAGGSITLDGAPLHALRPGSRAAAGISHVEQGRTVFKDMSTHDNLRVGLAAGVDVEQAYALFPELRQRRDVGAGLLSGGEQQMLVIARALLGRPKVLLIDEMSSGLAPIVVGRLMAAVRQLADRGLAVVLVEQFAALALGIGDRVVVMRRGRCVHEGPCADLRGRHDDLHKLYMG